MTELTETPDTPTLSALTDRLEQTLSTDPDPAILSQQAALLDQIFTTIIDEQVVPRLDTKSNYPETVQGWLAFALRAQKQSADALKTRATMEYMSALNTKALPPPPDPAKRTEEKP